MQKREFHCKELRFLRSIMIMQQETNVPIEASRFLLENGSPMNKECRGYFHTKTNTIKILSALPFLRENFRTMLQIEINNLLSGKQWPVVPAGSGQHCSDQPSSARPGNHIKIVHNPSIVPIKFLVHNNRFICT